MAAPKDLFNQYLTVDYAGNQKMAKLTEVADAKKQALSDKQTYAVGAGLITGSGNQAVPTQEEADLLSMAPAEILLKYGQERGTQLLAAASEGIDRYTADTQATRGLDEVLGDSALSALSGFGQAVGGPIAFGAGLVDEEAGTAIAGQLDRFSQYMTENKSDAINRQTQAFGQRSELNERDTEAQYNEAIDRGVSPTVAGIARFGKDLGNAVGDVATDPALAGDFAAQGVGSMAAIPLLAAGATAATPGILVGTGARAAAQVLGANRNAVRVGRAFEKALAPSVAIGAVEAGGTYQQTVNEVINTPFETLKQTSPQFNELVAGGMSEAEARQEIANSAGTQAGLTQLPASLVAGSLVARFEAAPAAARSLKGALQNIGKETIEEAAQSSTSQLATNQALADQVDPNKDVLAGVGTQAGVGAVAGAGTAGAVQVPGVIAQTGSDAAAATMKAVNQQVDSLRKKNEADSTVSNEKVAEAAATVQAAAPTVQEAVQNDTTLSDEEKQSLESLVTDVTDAFVNMDGDAVSQQADLPPVIQNAAKGQTTQVGFMQNLAKVANDESLPDDQRIFALAVLQQTGQAVQQALEPEMENLNKLAEDHPVRQYVSSIQKLNSALGSSPELTKANAAAEALVQKAVDNAPLTDATAPLHVMAAELAPQTTTKENVDTILRMADQGKVQITDNQRANLVMLSALHQNAQEYDQAVAEMGETPESIVSTAIKTGTTGAEGEQSAMQHAAGIRRSMLVGDAESARVKLEDLGLFAQHMQNKVNAVNAHINSENPTFANAPSYQKLVGTPGNRQFVDSGKSKSGVTPTSSTSVRHAQLVAAEADFVTKTYNTLAEIYPELGLPTMEFSELDTQLKGNFEEVAQKFTEAKEKAKTEPTKTQAKAEPKAQPQAKSAPAAKPAATTEPVKEPAPVPLTVDDDFKAAVSKSIAGMDDAKLNRMITRVTNDLLTEDNPRKVFALNAMMDEAESRVAAAQPIDEEVAPAPVAVAEPEPVVADNVQTVEPLTEPEDDTFQADPMQARYPLLASGRLAQAFKLPLEPISNLDGSRTPINDVVRGLEATIDDRTTVQAFKYVLGQFPSVLTYLNDNLNDFLNKKISGTTMGQGALDGTVDPTVYPNGRAFAIAEMDTVNGGFKLNTELVGKAYLAGINWLLNGMSFVAPYDVERASKVLGIPEDQITEEQMELLANGVTRLQAIDALANNIQRYWGFTADQTVVDGFTKGIPQAMAANIIDTMLKMTFTTGGEDVPVLVQTKLDIGVEGAPKTMDVFTPLSFANTPLTNFRGAIEKLVAAQPEQVVYMGKDVPPVASTQMNNRYVPNTPAQKEMIKNQNATGYTLNPQTWGAYQAMGIDFIVDLFGEGTLDAATTNKNDLISKEGRNVNIVSAWEMANQTIFSMEAQADEDGIPLDQVQVHYAHNVTSVGRAQQLGRYTPQSSKLMRTLLLPTNSKVMNLADTTGQDYRAFVLGMGQLLGVKVHNFDPEVTEQKLNTLVTGKYAPVIAVLQDHLANEGRAFSVTELNMFKDVLGKPTFETFQGLVEYARFLNTADKSQYTTQLYLEADGMSNGPFNSMALFAMGDFTVDQLNNLAKCGLYVGGAAAGQNSWVQRTLDPVDLYETVSTRTKDAVGDLTESANNQATRSRDKRQRDSGSNWLAQQSNLNRMMALLIPDMVTLNDDGTIDTSRGISKNPTTITTYGSGKAGIGDKLTNAMLENLYSMISAALKVRADNPNVSAADAMFPNDENADAKLFALDHAMKELTSKVARLSDKGFYVQQVPGASEEQIDISTDYTIGRGAFQVLTQNVRNMFVDPMHSAIQKTLHPSVHMSTDMLRTATQVQSIILGAAYAKRVREVLPKKGEEGYVLGGFLSQKQQADIFASLAPLNGMIQTGQQNYFIANSEKVGLAGETAYGSSFQDNIRTPATVYAPSDAGVKGIATMVIGSGDGMTIQRVSQDPEQTERAVFIFDGINYPLDFIQQGSLAANKAAFEAIQGNPMREVADSFQAFMDAFKENKNGWVDMTPELKAQLAKAIWGDGISVEEAAEIPDEQIFNGMSGVNASADSFANSIQARHDVLAKVNLGMDQMAAAGSPYLVTNKVQLMGTKEEIAQQLNDMMKEQVMLEDEMNRDKNTDISGVLAEFPVDDYGVRLVSTTSLQGLADSLLRLIPRNQAFVLSKAIKNAVAEGFSIRIGTPEQLAEYNASLGANGVDPDALADSDGITRWGTKEIWLSNASSETLAHELIHASTYTNVLGHTYAKYDGEPVTVDKAVADSVDAIEDLMNQFLAEGDKIVQANFKGYEAYRTAHDTITAALSDTDLTEGERKAVAINEYMAWGLANKDLAKGQANVPVTLVKIIKDTIEKILNWVLFPTTGKRIDNMLSNLVFHTDIIMSHTQPSLSAMSNDTALMQSKVYGDAERLAEVDRTFNKKITDYVTDQLTTTEVSKSAINADFVAGVFTANGFPMTAQELNVFKKMVTAMGTHAELDPNVMNRMQELYSAATSQLSPESFLAQPVNPTPADEAQAKEKYDAIMGRKGFGRDVMARTTLMPSFIALATVNQTMRDVLAKMPVPRTLASDQERAFDALLENQANKFLDGLSDVLTGDKRSTNITQSIDNLNRQLTQAAQDSEGFYDQYVTPLGSQVDKANSLIVDGMIRLSHTFVNMADARRQAGKDKTLIQQAANNGLELAASVLNEERAGLMGEAILAGANSTDRLPKWLHDIVADLVGRVDSNAALYDMIKKVRSSVQRLRNQFRTELPKTLAKQFTRKVTKEEWSAMHTAIGKTDLASLVQNNHFNRDQVMDMLNNQPALNRGIRQMEDQIKKADAKFGAVYLNKANQLAEFMMTGVPGQNLQRNAIAISRRLGSVNKNISTRPDLEKAIDTLVSLYALNKVPTAERGLVGSLAQDQKAGVEFAYGYAGSLRADELRRLGNTQGGQGYLNHYKGHMPSLQQDGVSLIIADDAEHGKLLEKSYTRKSAYQTSSLDTTNPIMSYYFAPVSGRAMFNQGILQNVRQTVSGVDSLTGYTVGAITAGRITDFKHVARISKMLALGYAEAGSNLMPVFDSTGTVVAYERTADPAMLTALNYNTNIGDVFGAWKGRLAEEELALQVNNVSIEQMADMYRTDTNNSAANKLQYVNLFSAQVQNKNPVILDALKLFTPSTIDAIHAQFPNGEFWVRKDMMDNVIGYRSATVGDAWTGNTYWSKETQETVRKLALTIMGNKAYAQLVNAEETLQGLVQDARTLIVVKSIVVPFANIMSNMMQLISRGVPLRSIVAGMPKKLAETRQYVASEKRAIEAEAEMFATTDKNQKRRLAVEIKAIRDSYKRMSIWPLIERGELSSMSDDAQPEDGDLTNGRLSNFIEAQVNKLPPKVRAAGKYALITKDTALYKGLRKSVEYGDFLAKAILWDDLVKRQGRDVEYANGRITEEFVNFDRLGGRNRQYLENMGLLWFYNFKIRSAKVGLAMLRNNPLHALMAGLTPVPGSIGSPITDNIFAQMVEGQLGHSIGLDQLLSAPMLHPLDNVLF